MYKFKVNGKNYSVQEDKKLLTFLREDLHLTGTKDGCSEGVCGACTVLIDGIKTKSCVIPLSKIEGKSVLTIEGISTYEMEVYKHCFSECGAVQCGFCTPGMVLSAKSLLDSNLNPTSEDIKKAIRGNLCRCTGYKKIEEAILMSASFFREKIKVPDEEEKLTVNSRAKRIDAPEKIDGSGIYVDDIHIDGMLYGKPLYSKYPRAIINKINIEKALNHPNCIKVITVKDVPCNKIGHIKQDWDVMMGEGDITRYVGNVLAVIVSDRYDKIDEIVSLIEVSYTELEPISSMEEALKENAPLIHPDGNILRKAILTRGNAEKVIAESKYVITRTYETSWQDHGFMEVECCIAMPEDDGLLIYTSSQSIYDVRRECANMLKIDKKKIHVKSTLVGGAFGGKEDMTVQPYAVLAAWILKKPVKVKYTRQESLNYHVKKHPMKMTFTTACDENGILTAMKGTVLADTGAYASLGSPVLERTCTHAAGPYNYQNVSIEGVSVYTNNVVSGAFRGFGVAQSCFATEMNINLLAEMVGIDPWEFRRRNAIKPNDVLPNGQIADSSTNLVGCLEAVKDIFYSNKYTGIACAYKNSGTGMGGTDTGRVILSVEKGLIHIRTSASCMGQGVAQMCLTEACMVTDLPQSLFVFEIPDTERTPDSGTSTASRQTVLTGEAVRRASESLKKELKNSSIKELEGKEFYGEFSPITDPLGSEKTNPVSHVSYSYGVQLVILNDEGKVEKVVSAFDVGKPINIQSVEGQIEGGTVMGLGFALTEKFKSEKSVPKSKFGTIGFMRSTDVPKMDVILCNVEDKDRFEYSLGAKGCGELCMIPTAPACAGAYYKLDGCFRQELPLKNTPYNKK